MRELKTGDIFIISQILNKMDMQEQLRIKMEKKGIIADKNTIGIDLPSVMSVILENMWRAEDDVIKLLSELKGVPPIEIRELKLNELIDLIRELIEVNGQNIASFL